MKRRQFLQSLGPFVSASLLAVPALSVGGILRSAQAGSRLRITGMDTFIVRTTARTNWIFVRLSTNQGLTGLGEASMERQCGPDTDLSDLEDFFSLVREESPVRYRALSPAGYRSRVGWKPASGHRVLRNRAGSVGSRRQSA